MGQKFANSSNMKYCLVSSILLPFFSFVASLPTADDNEVSDGDTSEKCTDVFSKIGLNYSSFWQGAGHGIHSLSLEEIRYFFKADAPEKNKIPTVNIDFRSENVVNFNAPLWGYEDRFDTWALKIMDWFMLNDQPYLYQNRANTLEKITHQYHMHEIYQSAAEIYKELVTTPPEDVIDVCKCTNDLTDNGILTEVVNIARQLKHFGEKSRQGTDRGLDRYKKKFKYKSKGNGFQLDRKKRSDIEEDSEDIEVLIKNFLANSNEETADKLISSDAGWNPGQLYGPDYDKWVPYAAMLTYSNPSDDGIKDFAYFIYCMLNHQE